MIPQRLTHFYEKPLVINHLQSMNDSDRRLRFGVVMSDESIEKYVDDQWDKPGAWFGAFDGERIVAVVHVAVDEKTNEAELGLSVDPEARGHKLGQKLFERAVIFLRSKNVRHVFMHCLSENSVMRHIASKYDMVLVTQYGETDARTTIDFPYTVMDPINEAVAQQLALYDNSIRTIASMWSRYIERIWNTIPKLEKVNNG